MKEAKRHVERAKKRLREDPEARYDRRFKLDRIKDRAHTSPFMHHWKAERGFLHYNTLFSSGLQSMRLGRGLIEALVRIPRGKGRPLEVLEDGPGIGIFLSELKFFMNAEGVKTVTTGVGVHHVKELKEAEKEGKIDKVVRMFGEFYLPRKPVHAIFSVNGSILYTTGALRKDTLLKFASALRKGGVMMVGFEFVEKRTPKSYLSQVMDTGFSENPIEERRMPIEKEMRGIERALQKRGFRAQFHPIHQALVKTYSIPNWTLIIKRER